MERRPSGLCCRSEGTLRLAQEAAMVGSFEYDLQTGRRTWSDQLIRLFGFDLDTSDPSQVDPAMALPLIIPRTGIRCGRHAAGDRGG
ncbi:MAG: hypothetical protein ACK5ZZ_07750 [Gemmatimonadaceae bacterium]|jgi:hypothetical protein